MIGPTFAGLFGSTVTLQDGSQVTADEAYLHQSIVQPNSQIVQGYPSGVMPQNFGQSLSEQEIQSLIAFIETLQ